MTCHLEKKLGQRLQCENLRSLPLPPSQPLIDFSSNDYLGLAGSSQAAQAVLKEWQEHIGTLNGLGSTGSRLLTGNLPYIEELENEIAEFHGFESGLLFNSGFMANVGLLTTVANHESVIYYDSGIHASTREGIRLSRAQAFPFKHNDLEHLEIRLKSKLNRKSCFICIESIYSTDGSMAPLTEICEIAKRYQAHVIVDEAHAVGACGPLGRGLAAKCNQIPNIYAAVFTFGKAAGCLGAIVLGNRLLKQALVNFASTFIYTTALAFINYAAIKNSYAIFPQMEAERSHLQKLASLFQEMNPRSSTHIQTLLLKGNVHAKQLSLDLRDLGFDIRPLTSPTVQRGKECLRICLHSYNTCSEVSALIDYLGTRLSNA